MNTDRKNTIRGPLGPCGRPQAGPPTLSGQFFLAALEVGWLENSCGGDDAGDEFGGGDVEAGVGGTAAGIGDAHVFALAVPSDAPRAADFVGVAFLDGDVEAGF